MNMKDLKRRERTTAGNHKRRSRPGTLAGGKPPCRAGTNSAQIDYIQVQYIQESQNTYRIQILHHPFYSPSRIPTVTINYIREGGWVTL